MRRVALLALFGLVLPTVFALAIPTAASANSVGFINISAQCVGEICGTATFSVASSDGMGSFDVMVDDMNSLAVISGSGGFECPIPISRTSTCTIISGGSVQVTWTALSSFSVWIRVLTLAVGS